MDRAKGQFERLLPLGEGASRRALLLSFGMWPVAVALMLRGQGVGLGSLGLMALPLVTTAFKRLRDQFPPGPTRRVITGYAGLYMALVVWVLLSHFNVAGIVVVVLACLASLRVLSRSEADGRRVVDAMIDRARLDSGLPSSTGPDEGDAQGGGRAPQAGGPASG